ncbi:MAG: NUDIX domain-containing protein [Oscillospiraceae bacterium]|nr:NUDIX domain-containing protein [Oscillospiraceae bacterium]
MTFEYCPKCGAELTGKQIGDEGIVPYCKNCERPWFPFSYPCVICLVINEDNEIALIRQTYGTKRSVCLAGFISCGETAEQTAVREIKEEIGLEVTNLDYIGSYFHERSDNLMLGFAARVKKAPFTLSPSEVENAEWFSLADAEAELSKGTVGICLLKDWLKNI